MKARRIDRLRELNDRSGDPLVTAMTLLLLLLLFVASPLAGHLGFKLIAAVVTLALIAGALVISGNALLVGAMMIGFCATAVGIVLRLWRPSAFDIALDAAGWLVISLCLAYAVARLVFGPGRVTHHRIVGAVLLYLLIATTFVAIFAFVGFVIPRAFSGLAVQDSPALAAELIYFSFVTLTSTGYGDIVPVHPIARSLCNLESIIGQLYPPILIARLVALEQASPR